MGFVGVRTVYLTFNSVRGGLSGGGVFSGQTHDRSVQLFTPSRCGVLSDAVVPPAARVGASGMLLRHDLSDYVTP